MIFRSIAIREAGLPVMQCRRRNDSPVADAAMLSAFSNVSGLFLAFEVLSKRAFPGSPLFLQSTVPCDVKAGYLVASSAS